MVLWAHFYDGGLGSMIVMKFGGSSVANADRIRHVGRIVQDALPRRPVVVLSAMGDTTDYLLEAAEKALEGTVALDSIKDLHIKTMADLGLPSSLNQEIQGLLKDLETLLVGISLIKEITPRTKDYLVSFGERLSVRIGAAYFRSLGFDARAFDAWDVGFVSDSNYTSAEVRKDCWPVIQDRISSLVSQGVVPVVTGFIAKDPQGAITTLGRGGSDLTATIIGAACKADEVQVWKDVDGILTADPRLVPEAVPVEQVTYEEAAELAYFGAQVLHPRSMQPCSAVGIPVRVKNSYNPSAPGTLIVSKLEKGGSLVRAITTKKNVTLVDIVSSRMLGQYGFLAGVFQCFADHRLSVDMVATSEVSISLTLDAPHDLAHLKRDLEKIASVDIKKNKAIVTLIGDVRRSSAILEKAFGVCNQEGVQVQMVSQGASKVNISFIVDNEEAPRIIQALHREFFKGGM